MLDHHPRFDRSDVGVRTPGKVWLREEKRAVKRNYRALVWLSLLVMLLVAGVAMFAMS